MYTKFNNLNDKKKNDIINASIEEFAQNGYYKASTDKIASNSSIAKGSLFHYFKNKRNLYLYIVEFCMDFVSEKIINESENIKSDDFYERIKLIAIYKQNIFISYPLYAKIISDALIIDNEEIKEYTQIIINKSQMESMNFIQNYIIKFMNTNYLHERATIEDALFITTTVFEAISKKYIEMHKKNPNEFSDNKEEIFKEFDRYINILKYGLYK